MMGAQRRVTLAVGVLLLVPGGASGCGGLLDLEDFTYNGAGRSAGASSGGGAGEHGIAGSSSGEDAGGQDDGGPQSGASGNASGAGGRRDDRGEAGADNGG